MISAKPTVNGLDSAITFWVESKDTGAKFEGEATVTGGFSKLVVESNYFLQNLNVLDFELVKVGKKKTISDAVQLKNIGNMDLSFTSDFENSCDIFTVHPDTGKLSPGEIMNLTFVCVPNEEGQFKHTWKVAEVESEKRPTKIRLVGSAANPKLSLSTKNVNYGKVLVGERVTQTIMITNCGGYKAECNFCILNNDDDSCISLSIKEAIIEPSKAIALDITFEPKNVCREDKPGYKKMYSSKLPLEATLKMTSS